MSNFGRMSRKRPKRSEQRKWIDKLDKVFSLYIRMRDSREFQYKAFRCISCGRYLPIDKADNGHYVSRANMSLRFDPRNCNAECTFCNRMSSDHLIGYRKNLVVKLGMSAFKNAHPGMSPIIEVVKSLGEREVELLEAEKYQTRKWSVFELQEAYKYYAALVLKMKDEM